MKFWMAVIASGLCVIAWFMWSLRDRPAEPVARAPSARTAKPVVMAPRANPSPALEPVRPAAAAPAAEPAAPTETAPTETAPTETAPTETAPTETAEPSTAKPAPNRGGMRDGLETLFQSDPYDPAWSQRTTETLTRGIHAVLPEGSRLQRLECRGRLCRIETSHADVDGYRAYTQGAFQGPETRVTTGAVFGTVIGEPVPGKPIAAVAFVARDGQELPDLETR
jgi:hypothetical protein